MDSIVLPTNFDVSKITYSEPRILDNGGKVIYISYDKKKLLLQTPEMSVPFGLGKWNNDGKGVDKYSIDLSFKGRESREVLAKFFDGLKSMDKKLVEDGLANSQSWFKKTHKSLDVVEALYTTMVKYPKDKNGEIIDKYPPTFKMSVPFDGTKFMCQVFDNAKNLVDLNNLEVKGSKISAIVQCMGIWVAGTKFGCSWKVVQMKVTPPSTIKGYAFKEIEDKTEKDIDDDDDEETDPNDVLEHADGGAIAASGNADEDDDEDEVEESDDELDGKASASKPVVKKIVKK